MQEKNILLKLELQPNTTLDEVLDILSDNIIGYDESFSYIEKKLVLLMLRSYSISEKVTINFKCPHCNRVNDQSITINDIIKEPSQQSVDIKGVEYKVKFCVDELTQENLHAFTHHSEDEIDELSNKDFEVLFNFINDNRYMLDFTYVCKCFSCKESVVQCFDDEQFILKSLSEDDVMSLYNTVNDLVFHGRYSKYDVDNMLPFERNIFLGLVLETINKLK